MQLTIDIRESALDNLKSDIKILSKELINDEIVKVVRLREDKNLNLNEK